MFINFCSKLGKICCKFSHFAEKIAAKGLIAMVYSNTPPIQLAHGAKERATGTNPITFVAP